MIGSRTIPGVNGLDMHLLEAGDPAHPALLLLHGFPELAYSWRKVMEPLAAAGYHVIAPDQRGFGATTGWDAAYDGDWRQFRLLNLARDALALLRALGHDRAAVAGHDFGAAVAGTCALARPDVFHRLAIMSAPYTGPVGGRENPDPELARLDPPRKHYQGYYSTRQAVAEMDHPPQGMAAFLRAYFHMKSADWPGNHPVALPGWTAAALARLPDYYIMPLHASMPQAVAPHLPVQPNTWLTDDELATYVRAFERTGFAGGLAWYRCRTDGGNADLDLFAGRTVDVPAMFIAGATDWGVQQSPGALETMRDRVCTDMRAVHLVDGAGHWVQQEQPGAVVHAMRDWLGAAQR
jgi:pimeloyl-ACP methyl ester carboxylesterase